MDAGTATGFQPEGGGGGDFFGITLLKGIRNNSQEKGTKLKKGTTLKKKEQHSKKGAKFTKPRGPGWMDGLMNNGWIDV